MEDNWIQWKPAENLQAKYYIEALCDSLQGFKIVLSDVNDRNKRVLINFRTSAYAYRRTDETSRYRLILQLKEKYGGSFYGNCSLFKVENSSYVKWVIEESEEIVADREFLHFCIIAGDSVLDIIDYDEPEVTIIDSAEYMVGATFTFDNVK
jgi:hypothetical protein